MELWETPLVKDYFHHVKICASFEMPPSTKALFEAYHKHFFHFPRPEFTMELGPNAKNWRWQQRHTAAMLDSVQSTVAAVYYHRDNIRRIEREILSFARLDELTAAMGNSGMGGGNTLKLDFEYHGFIFAYRRSLDYLARGIAALLRQEFHSFRSLPNNLRPFMESDWVKQIAKTHETYAPKLGSFLSSEKGKSSRDILAHYSHVPAGCLNVNAKGIFLAGGGEKLGIGASLGNVVQTNIDLLERILTEVFQAIIRGFPKIERT